MILTVQIPKSSEKSLFQYRIFYHKSHRDWAAIAAAPTRCDAGDSRREPLHGNEQRRYEPCYGAVPCPRDYNKCVKKIRSFKCYGTETGTRA